MSARRAVILFNLGGPDSLEAVRPFLFNLFNDPAILRRGTALRWLLAKLIARRRAGTARRSYRRIGGRSPLLEQTRAQAAALEAALANPGADPGADPNVKVFVCMRYWHPMARQVVEEVARYAPDEIVLLPLYPQFSSSTTASSLRQWHELAAGRLSAPAAAICCYPDEDGFIAALTARLEAALADWHGPAPRILYSAHGVPRAFVEAGDPYQGQIERTVAAVRARLGREDLDQVLCYQSRVGPLEWIAPYTDAEIERAGAEGRPVVLLPVAFVSEHSETLVELDHDYRLLAERAGVPRYVRVATVGTDARFIAALARLARLASERRPDIAPRTIPGTIPGGGARICGTGCRDCPIAPSGREREAA